MGCATKTTCPYCGVGCGVIATPKPDGTVEIKGDKDHPANFGRLCSKGFALGETVDLDGRLLFPEIYDERSSWDDALDLVASTFSKTIAEHGPDSVAFYVSGQILTEDYYVANKLMKGFIGSANIDTNSRLCMASSVAGHRRAFGSDTVPGVYEDLEQADLIVLTGSNLAWCHPVIYQRIAAAKAARPSMKIVLIDPRRTMTADIVDLHLAIAPDGDVALFMGLLQQISEQGAINAEYVTQFTNGIDEALSAAKAISFDEIATQCGLNKIELKAFYDLWISNEKVVTVYSQGVNQSSSGTDKVNAIINCHLATARIGKAGMGPFSITGQPNAMGGREVGGLANTLAAHMAIENPEHRDRVQRFWDAPTISDKQGFKATEMFDAVADGRIKAIWIMATNPVDSMPDADKVEAALKICPFVVVSDVVADTDTVRHAHVKLPSLAWGEKDGTVTNSERRISHQKAFLSAPKKTKSDWWQMAEIGKRMGFAEAFDFENSAAIFREYAAQTAFENDGSRDLDIGAYAGITDSAYAELEPFQWPKIKGQIGKPNETRFFANGGFFTSDRKANFIAVEPKGSIDSDNTLVINTGRIRDQWHTMTRTAKSARLSSHLAEPFIEINPADASRHNISDADLVLIKNQRSNIILRALITDRVQQGHVFVPMHFTDQVAANARVNKLIEANVDPISGQPALKSSSGVIKKFAASSFGFIVSSEPPKLEHVRRRWNHRSRKDVAQNIHLERRCVSTKRRNALTGLPYWALAKAENGWRAEFATDQKIDDVEAFCCAMLGLEENYPLLVFKDRSSGFTRIAAFNAGQLIGAIYLAAKPVSVSRSWAVEQLGNSFDDLASRWRIVAGHPAADMPDKGAIICSCMGVGTNEIATAILAGCRTVEAVGKQTCAGTNCGSCKAEIKGIINEHQIIAAE